MKRQASDRPQRDPPGKAQTLSPLLLVVALAVCPGAMQAEAPGGPDGEPFVVVVHPENPVRELDRTFLERAFLGKTTRWPDGRSIEPVDLRPGTPVRALFSSEVLGRPVRAVQTYWQQAIFSGRRVPPPVVRTSEEVVEYVLSRPGAIGYVAPGTPLRRAHVVRVR